MAALKELECKADRVKQFYEYFQTLQSSPLRLLVFLKDGKPSLNLVKPSKAHIFPQLQYILIFYKIEYKNKSNKL